MVLEPEEIPYGELTGDLFREERTQKVIPFLGAGVSTSARTAPADDNAVQKKDPRIAEALACLQHQSQEQENVVTDGDPPLILDETTLLYAEIALEMAFLIQGMRNSPQQIRDSELLDRLSDDTYPPTASELVDWLSASVSFGSFEGVLARVSSRLRRTLDDNYRRSLLKLLRSLAGVAGVAPASLPAASAFFEAVRHRETLLDRLAQILRNKTTPTPAHALLARAASWHLAASRKRGERALPGGTGHYLIMTTNYDCLMEQSLEVPFVVLTLGLKDSLVRARFGNLSSDLQAAYEAANPPRSPRAFSLEPPSPDVLVQLGAVPRLAVVYKVHGCISDWMDRGSGPPRDSIVISDNDYVTNISRFSDNDGVIPACVSDILSSKERPYFLFMGYSLRDWNVRGMLRAVRTKRAGVGREDDDYGDYSVIRNFGQLEHAFFLKHNIRIIHEDLTCFSTNIDKLATERYGA